MQTKHAFFKSTDPAAPPLRHSAGWGHRCHSNNNSSSTVKPKLHIHATSSSTTQQTHPCCFTAVLLATVSRKKTCSCGAGAPHGPFLLSLLRQRTCQHGRPACTARRNQPEVHNTKKHTHTRLLVAKIAQQTKRGVAHAWSALHCAEPCSSPKPQNPDPATPLTRCRAEPMAGFKPHSARV
jgi:hypothetical protein